MKKNEEISSFNKLSSDIKGHIMTFINLPDYFSLLNTSRITKDDLLFTVTKTSKLKSKELGMIQIKLLNQWKQEEETSDKKYQRHCNFIFKNVSFACLFLIFSIFICMIPVIVGPNGLNSRVNSVLYYCIIASCIDIMITPFLYLLTIGGSKVRSMECCKSVDATIRWPETDVLMFNLVMNQYKKQRVEYYCSSYT